jgi:hypothetical protein
VGQEGSAGGCESRETKVVGAITDLQFRQRLPRSGVNPS